MLRKVLFPPLSCHAAFANDIASLEVYLFIYFIIYLETSAEWS